MSLMDLPSFHFESEMGGMVLEVPEARSASASALTFLASSSVTNPFLINKSKSGSGGSAHEPIVATHIPSIATMLTTQKWLRPVARHFIGRTLVAARVDSVALLLNS